MVRRAGHGATLPTPTPPAPPPPPPPPRPPPPCTMALVSLLVLLGLLSSGACSQYGDAEHITAILGESVVLNCPVSQPKIAYIIQWKKQHHKIPIYIWYEGYDPHVEENYKGRASRVNPDTTYGLASLNLTSVKEEDQGWYECKVFYLDRTGATDNGTWIHLDVHAPPRFTTTPDDVTYVNIGDSIILNCEAEGTPKPEIFWYRDDKTVEPSETVGIFNDGTELRINKIRDEDIGDYVCVARNPEGRVHHDAKVVIAGGAVIVKPPQNQTLLEGEKVEFPCEAKALPGNVTVNWKREGVSIDKLSWLDSRSFIRRDGALVINPTSSEDGGFFTCEVSNGIGTPQKATAYLNVEYPARVTFTPTVQYLPFRQQGIIKCYIKSNPAIQFVTWIKDKRLFDADHDSTVVKLNNGSLLITKVNQSHQGRYSCTPYNRHTTAGSSGDMEVLVRDPPIITPRPQPQYHGQVGEEVTLVCGGQGSPTPEVTWRRRDSHNLPRDRTSIIGGNLTIRNLHKSDHAYYECVVSNDIATLVTTTQLLVEGTTPHPPYNISAVTQPFSIKLSWLPGYPGGKDWEQQYTIWYRGLGSRTWSQIEVKPKGSTSVTIYNLDPEHTYEIQVQGKNALGDGMFSDIITATTKVYDYSMVVFPTDASGATYVPTILNPSGSLPLGPPPQPPRKVTIKKAKDGSDGYIISWLPPENLTVPVAYYDIEYRIDGTWKKLNEDHITGTKFKVKKLQSGKKYHFRVYSKTLRSYSHSPTVSFDAPIQNKEKAITAALVGGILFFIVAIILSVCTVKICNKRKRRKQEKEIESHIFYDTAYDVVACRVSESRNGGHGSSPVPLKKLLRCGIPGLRWEWAWVAGVLLGSRLLDSTDSRPLDTSTTTQDLGSRGQDVAGSSADEDFREYGVERGRRFPRDVHYSVELEYTQPLSWISRTTDGRFVLDEDSEEGGFTSPRRPIRSVGGRQASRIQSRVPPEWPREEGQGVESGVYHVRAGAASRQLRRQPLPPRLSLRSDGSGASTHEEPRVGGAGLGGPHTVPAGRYGVFHPHTSMRSPEFGRHVIPESPSDSVWSPRSRRFRASSPGPLSSEWSQLAQLASFSEVSSVQQPSSVERSFPSTVLSSFPNSAQDTPTALGISATLPPPRREELLPSRQYPGRQLPPLSTSQLRSGQILVGAQVHSPPSRFQPQLQAWGSTSRSQLDPAWITPRRPARVWPMARPVGHAARPSGRPVVTVLESGQHVHAPPMVREALGHIQPPRIPDIPRHYVNLPPRRDTDQRILGRAPPCLLKPSSSENQKPLATSSPPRPRATQGQPGAQRLARTRPLPPPPPTSTKTSRAPEPAVPRAPGRTRDSDSSSDQPVTYTRERLQEAIGRVRSGLFGEAPRTSSAPELRPAGRSEPRQTTRHQPRPAYGGSAPESREQSHEQSQEQSPDSSSGFGSKNTSQQQSSSQSGQSLLALGLDTSRLEASEATEPGEVPEPAAGAPPAWVLAGPRARPTPWMRPPNPPPYEEWAARQVLPQFRMPVLSQQHKPYIIPSVSERRQMLGSAGLDASVDSSSSVKVSPRPRPRPPPPITTPLPPQQPLDVSVDDHYEFDTVLSPTPGEDSAAEWSRTRVPSGERGLSDSEIYGSGGRRRHQSMEARVAAMKQEFNEYRKRQARRRRSREMESVC
ncbi:protein turtle-like isoform X4 [Eriocheir sinensis]|uniref:protein turtle-like isoform X4 n=1 Tax=Eriocheir sinensis TaxID=95602 RepID=UPI0021CAAE18|nr:protein turtle-like isoform X4 [Eriocheir sinensis]